VHQKNLTAGEAAQIPPFYSIHPLVEWAFQPGMPFDISRFIVQLRLTTLILMRSCDVANIT
jgi:hypothetical protein